MPYRSNCPVISFTCSSVRRPLKPNPAPLTTSRFLKLAPDIEARYAEGLRRIPTIGIFCLFLRLTERVTPGDPRIKTMLCLPFNDPEAAYRTVKDLGGTTHEVRVTDSTRVKQSTTVTVQDLAAGTTVTVSGTKQDDGSVDATAATGRWEHPPSERHPP